ncbi:hypothetical protein KSP35_20465 [Aquihabitans sp. G128]|uniref:hypothetical protein n=1 Tax=Aquihabitans sp. G128 TaxID=2849779 RepID=UPI001C2208EE|nr:hypothetical protein [Aquihabitans sp. G128]QXC60667.1 hypothetical protein KSP35_20465 [Aquihabitans sp. G128]
MGFAATRDLDPTPPRPPAPIATPASVVRLVIDVEAAHLANPLVAASRLLASEAGALAHVDGDEGHFEVTVAVPDRSPEIVDQAEAWVRWAIHNAGIRGEIRRVH